MKKNINIEAEGSELILKNKVGDYVIIPKKYRTEVQDMIKDGCHGCIDSLVSTLPVMADYAEDGSLLPGFDEIIATLNPKNWGVPDYTDKGSRGAAYAAARKAGEKEFMWNNQRFSTDYDGTPQQQLKETGITDEQLQGKSILRNRIVNNVYPAEYGHVKESIKNIFNNTPDYRKKDSYSEPYLNIQDDALRLVMGKPQKHDSFSISKYKPTITKENQETIYYTLKSIKDDLAYYAYKANNGELKKERQVMKSYGQSDGGLGDYTIDFGKDEKGDYISIYDINDYAPLGKYGEQTKLQQKIASPIGKKFEIYDRYYYRFPENSKYPEEIYYSNKELSELDPNKRNFDTLALQRELSNRGYKLPKSTKKDGTFDGVWGDETKAALLDYQKSYKNKNK